MSDGLEGLHVLVTRPQRFAAPLARAVEERGGRVTLCPALEILGPEDPRCLAQLHEEFLRGVAAAVFVSRNAVEWALRLAPAPRALAEIPALAPGPGSAALLRQRGFRRVLSPVSGTGSEALLEVEELGHANIAGATILLFRGQGGRALLRRELRRRGARLHCLKVYRRAAPPHGHALLGRLLREDPPDLTVVTSGDALRNLYAMCEEKSLRQTLERLPLLVPASRVAALARARLAEDTQVSIATGADNAGLLRGIQVFYKEFRARRGPAGITREDNP